MATDGAGLHVTDLIDAHPLGPMQIRVLALCMCVAIVDGFDTQSISFAAPMIAREWGAPREAFGAIFSAGIAGMMAGLVLQGPIGDRLGRKPVIILSLLIFGGCSLLTMWAESMTDLLMLRFITGIGMGAAVPNIVALTSEYAPARSRSRMIVLMNAGLPAGGLLGGALSAYLLADHGWRYIFLAGGVAPLVLAAVALRKLPESIPFLMQRAARGHERSGNDLTRAHRLLKQLGIRDVEAATLSLPHPERSSLAGLFREGRRTATILIWIVFLLNMLLYYFLISWLPLILTAAGASAQDAALAASMLNVGAIFGGLALAWVADRAGLERTLTINYIVGAMLFLLLGASLGSDILAVSALLATLGFATGGAQLLLNVLAASHYPIAMRSTGIGIAGIAGRLGAVSGPLAGSGLAAIGVSYAAQLSMLAVPAALAAAVVSWLRVKRG